MNKELKSIIIGTILFILLSLAVMALTNPEPSGLKGRGVPDDAIQNCGPGGSPCY